MALTLADFEQNAGQYRRELLAHCYKMLGSVQDAEDLVQDTYLRAWQARERYDESKASVRTWLYRIATNGCLTALERRDRRPLPSGLVARSEEPEEPLVRGEVAWLQPFPDALMTDDVADPAVTVVNRSVMRLALVAAMQFLPPRQRATLILREVLDFSAAEVADILGTTTASVNSALQRARVRLHETGTAIDEVDEPPEHTRRAYIDRYVEAFENADVAALKQLLTKQALLEMPPMLNWYLGRDDYARFIARVFAARGSDWRMLPSAANGQPALACYMGSGNGEYMLHSLQVFTVTVDGISRNTVFQDSAVFGIFNLPLAFRADSINEMSES